MLPNCRSLFKIPQQVPSSFVQRNCWEWLQVQGLERAAYVRYKLEGYFTYAEVRESEFPTKSKLIDLGDKCLWSCSSCHASFSQKKYRLPVTGARYSAIMQTIFLIVAAICWKSSYGECFEFSPLRTRLSCTFKRISWSTSFEINGIFRHTVTVVLTEASKFVILF